MTKTIKTIYRRELSGLGLYIMFPYGYWVNIDVGKCVDIFDPYERFEYKHFLRKHLVWTNKTLKIISKKTFGV